MHTWNFTLISFKKIPSVCVPDYVCVIQNHRLVQQSHPRPPVPGQGKLLPVELELEAAEAALDNGVVDGQDLVLEKRVHVGDYTFRMVTVAFCSFFSLF